MAEISLRKENLEKILDVMDKVNPSYDYVKISEDNSSGIGPVVLAEFEVKINGVTGSFKTVIIDDKDW